MKLICEREVLDPSDGKPITTRIGKPEQVAEGKYQSAFQVQSLGNSQVQYAHGIDSVQAMQNALERIRSGIEKSGRSFSWQGGEAGDAGFPRSVPTFFGLELSQRINRLIDEEVERLAGEAEKRAIQRP